jgi:hypothetical protein
MTSKTIEITAFGYADYGIPQFSILVKTSDMRDCNTTIYADALFVLLELKDEDYIGLPYANLIGDVFVLESKVTCIFKHEKKG